MELKGLQAGLKYLVEDCKETQVIDVNGHKYSTKGLYEVNDPTPETIGTTTLTALIDYIKTGYDKKASEKLIVHVVGPDRVRLMSELTDDKKREFYMQCDALLPSNIRYNHFINVEDFNIMMQSSFVETDDKAAILKLTGTIQDNEVAEYGDDGVSQSVTVKTGVAKVGKGIVPNPVVLAPYRTFPEVEQPESKFIFRMQSGPAAALFEADGGAWRNKAMEEIAVYLKSALADVNYVKVIY